MGDLSQYLAMGGYATFVWSAYGAVLMVMAAVLIVSLRSLKQRESELSLLRGRVGRRHARTRPQAEVSGGATG